MEAGEMAGPGSAQRYVLYSDVLPGPETVASLLSFISVRTVGLAKPSVLGASQIFTQNEVSQVHHFYAKATLPSGWSSLYPPSA